MDKTEVKQVEEMAKAMCGNGMPNGNCAMDDEPCNLECVYGCCAEKSYAKGYRKQSEWISVEERLPDEQGHFLIVDKEGQMNTAFYTPRFGWFSHFRIKNITHWMPLPEPPKKGGAE